MSVCVCVYVCACVCVCMFVLLSQKPDTEVKMMHSHFEGDQDPKFLRCRHRKVSPVEYGLALSVSLLRENPCLQLI